MSTLMLYIINIAHVNKHLVSRIKKNQITVELGYNVMKGTEYFVSL
jgi:hypothetical protein